jgi:AcrR family transcriptional regulator
MAMTATSDPGWAPALDALSHLKRPRTQRHDPVTVAFLDAGLELFAEVFSDESAGTSSERVPTIKPLSWLQVSLLERRAAARSSRGAGGAPTRGALYERWPSKDHFVADLLAYAIASTRWEGHIADADELAAALVPESTPPSALIAALAGAEFGFVEQTLPWQLEQHLAPVSSAYPAIARTLKQTYDVVTDGWVEIYAKVLDGYGVRLRDGVTYRDLTVILTALTDGFLTRRQVDPAEVVGDDGEGRMALACAAVLAALTVPADSGDHRTVTEVLDAIAEVGQTA